jgi:hypothetical protein
MVLPTKTAALFAGMHLVGRARLKISPTKIPTL